MENKFKILIVEDDSIDARFFEHILLNGKYDVTIANDSKKALNALSLSSYQLVLVDLKMLDIDGMQLLELIKRYYPNLEVIIITAHASVETAVEAMRRGAYSYFIKGDKPQKLLADIRNIAKISNDTPQEIQTQNSSQFSCLKARGALFTSFLEQARAVAGLKTNLLLVGAPGTGREALANYIHSCSPRKNLPVHTIDFSKFDETIQAYNILEKSGLSDFFSKNGPAGTLILLNVGKGKPHVLKDIFTELDRNIPKHNGEKTSIAVISTTTQQGTWGLKGVYGAELFFQYWGMALELPNINERREDLPLIIDDLIDVLNSELSTTITGVEEIFLKKLSTTFFIKEFAGLEATLRRLMKYVGHGQLKLEHMDIVDTSDAILGSSSPVAPGEPVSLKEARERSEQAFIQVVMDRTGGNKTRAATALGISARQLYNMLKKYKLE
ncbi:MAG TPA: hypothetical protein DCS48_12430 [Desulfovibrio sp.]|nr:hypothetical protein [Desulfovibrio sp.]